MISAEASPSFGRPFSSSCTSNTAQQARSSSFLGSFRPSHRRLTATSCNASACSNFETGASGEWEGVTATFDPSGRPLELPYHQVPAAFREWGVHVQDWQTQCSMSASGGSLTYRLRRLLPVAGCEEDSISFEEEYFTEIMPHLHETSPSSVLPGSYALALRQPAAPGGQPRLRMEHCFMVAAEERLRIVQHAVLEGEWRAGSIEVHHERKEGPFRHGAPLGGCGASMANISDAHPVHHSTWQAAVFKDPPANDHQQNEDLLKQHGISILPKGCWCQLLPKEGTRSIFMAGPKPCCITPLDRTFPAPHKGCRGRAVAAATPGNQPEGAQPQAPSEARRKRVLSGIQPTGGLHLGNYFGAMRSWINLQELYDCYFCMVDLHAITLPHDPIALQEDTRKAAALYMACGIDPAKSVIFVQSHVSAHAELAWLLMTQTPVGWLNRMIQWKEKSRKVGSEEVGAGLLTYPVLQAADILAYQTDVVPVGEDQKQHIELARDIAERMNSRYGGKPWKKLGGRGGRIFKVPDIMMPPAGARVMSLTEGSAKMSKSAELDASRINLLDSPKDVQNKIKRAKTDAGEGLEYDNPERPEARNLLTLYALATGHSLESAQREVGSLRWGDFKPRLADAMVAMLEPIQQRYNEIRADDAHLTQVLSEGAAKADATASRSLERCQQAMGFVPRVPVP
ncbi:hypothetical protein WJX74_006524 [Apatococcus lobatus]|uniref:tryptophan--tRNA ligase n=1 Tax=Apatococcus lobatus TaxID=904363 RepID=A0AAW1QVN6_9CHLO